MEKINKKCDAVFAGRLYGSYLESNRTRSGFTLKQVSLGLCSDSELNEIENGKKNAGWLCRERLLLRAGAEREECESDLNCDDFAEWEIQKETAELEEWQECFLEMYRRFGNLTQENPDAWLYQRQDVFCIGDVIRIRRQMLKMTRKKLYDGICSEDTLKRLERKKKNTHPPILWELCKRLGLSPECERTELVTANPRARELEIEIRRAANDGKFKENLVRIKELKTLIDMSDKINQQWVLRTEWMACIY